MKDSGKELEEQKLVKKALLSAYEKNIASRLKAELCLSTDPVTYVGSGVASLPSETSNIPQKLC